MGFLLDHDSHSQPKEKFKIAEMSSVSCLKNESILFINVCVCVVHVRTLPPVAGTDVHIWCVQVQIVSTWCRYSSQDTVQVLASVSGAGIVVCIQYKSKCPSLIQVQTSVSVAKMVKVQTCVSDVHTGRGGSI